MFVATTSIEFIFLFNAKSCSVKTCIMQLSISTSVGWANKNSMTHTAVTNLLHALDNNSNTSLYVFHLISIKGIINHRMKSSNLVWWLTYRINILIQLFGFSFFPSNSKFTIVDKSTLMSPNEIHVLYFWAVFVWMKRRLLQTWIDNIPFLYDFHI